MFVSVLFIHIVKIVVNHDCVAFLIHRDIVAADTPRWCPNPAVIVVYVIASWNYEGAQATPLHKLRQSFAPAVANIVRWQP